MNPEQDIMAAFEEYAAKNNIKVSRNKKGFYGKQTLRKYKLFAAGWGASKS